MIFYILSCHCRRAIQKVLNTEEEKLQETLKLRLREVEFVSITMDIWSDASMRGFLRMTAHFIDGDIPLLQTRILSVPRFQGWYFLYLAV